MPWEYLPSGWIVAVALILLLFGGGSGGVVYLIRKEVRDSRLQPTVQAQQELETKQAASEFLGMLRAEQAEAMAGMRQLLADARQEAASARTEAHEARTESKLLRVKVEELELARERDRTAADAERRAAAAFRERVERLLAELRADGVVLPPWWVEGA